MSFNRGKDKKSSAVGWHQLKIMIKITRLRFFLLSLVLPKLLTSSQNVWFVAANSFEELALNCSVYVDKTTFIKDFIQTNFTLSDQRDDLYFNDTVHVLRLTYPRKWGKTMNLKMLANFLQMEVNKKGNQKHTQDTSAYRLFVRGQWSTGGSTKLNIAQHTEILDKYVANHPVIFLALSSVTGTTYAEIVSGVKHAISEAFHAHSYMIKVYKERMQDNSASAEVKNRTRDDLLQFQAYMSGEASEATILTGVKFLSEQLCQHFGKRVYVFIDDHDQPLRSIFSAGISDPKLIKAVSLFLNRVILCSFYQLCFHYRPNLAVEKAIITGVMRVVPFPEDAKLMEGMDYNQELSLFDHNFNRYFGFSEEEVKVVFNLAHIDQKLAESAKKWYGDYTVLDVPYKVFFTKRVLQKFRTQKKRCFTTVYNPYDIERFAAAGKISSYWAHSGSVPLLSDFLRNKMVESFVISLLNSEKVIVDLYELVFTSEELHQLTNMLGTAVSVVPLPAPSGQEAELFFSFLLGEGYLTLHEDVHESMTRLRLPNEEITLDLSIKLLQHYTCANRISNDLQNQVGEGFKQLVEGNNTKFKEALEALFLSLPKFTDQSNACAENVVRSALNTIILTSKQVFEADCAILLRKDERSKPGCSDTPSIMLTLERLQLGVVMQLMYNAGANSLAQVKTFAKSFIKNKSIKNVWLIAVNVLPNKSVEINEVRKRNRRFF